MTDLDVEKQRAFEWANFFHQKREALAAKRDHRDTTPYLDEIDAMAMHSDQPLLRAQADRFLIDINIPDRAAG